MAERPEQPISEVPLLSVGERRQIVAPAWAGAVIPIRALAQPVVELATRRRVAGALEVARTEQVELTTPQPAA